MKIFRATRDINLSDYKSMHGRPYEYVYEMKQDEYICVDEYSFEYYPDTWKQLEFIGQVKSSFNNQLTKETTIKPILIGKLHIIKNKIELQLKQINDFIKHLEDKE